MRRQQLSDVEPPKAIKAFFPRRLGCAGAPSRRGRSRHNSPPVPKERVTKRGERATKRKEGRPMPPPEVDLKVAMESLAGVIKYLNLTSDSENFGHFRMSTFDFSQYVRINSAAIRALGVLPGSDDQKADLSLLKVLNRCRTPGGQRLLAQWLKQPLTDVRKIEERLEMVELFVQRGELRHCLHEDYLRHFPDLLRAAKRLQRHKSTLQELYKTYQTLKVLPKVREVLAKAADEDKRAVLQGLFVKPLAELEKDFSKYLEMVETTLDLEAAESGDFLVKPDFDDDLQALREELDSLEAKCHGYLDKAARDLGLEAGKTIKLESSKDLGFHFRITRKAPTCLRPTGLRQTRRTTPATGHINIPWNQTFQAPNNYLRAHQRGALLHSPSVVQSNAEERALRSRKGYVVIDTKQNGVRFRSPDLLSSNASYLDTRKAYEEAQQSIAKMIVDIAGGYAEPMHQLSDVISHLDVLVGLAVAAASASKPYVRPKILEKGSSSCYIITGPNMGGKSTYIRSLPKQPSGGASSDSGRVVVALAVLMAQVGSFVPCDSAELSLVDAVLTRIGAGDQQLKGVSTFMAEMLESAHILRNATADSLVVIDELGRGTSTYDGFGLAWAISEHLSKEADAYCLFATHFHELTELAQELPCVRNVHVTADVREDSFTLLYKVKPGGWLKRHKLAPDRACCTRLGPGRNDGAGLAGLAHGDPQSGPLRVSCCDSLGQLAHTVLAWEGRSAGLDMDSGLRALNDGRQPGSAGSYCRLSRMSNWEVQ
ncbi:hypothetical protein HPB47_022391 [Ixodes persulcatus]|uniref:Uncharacterized protein n=1 Tax=Ixodes persulcatus TaxID=34615 RepID=A0AC60QAX1_IXOPE|nr:hypothetical protein HPB47_022391 [Ixodes persulcatus]